MIKRKYSDEERLKIIAEAKESGNISATAKRYGIADVTIHGWIRKGHNSKPKNDLVREVKKLKRLLADRELECAILKDLVKKTVQVWSSEDQRLMNSSPSDILRVKL